MIFVIIFSIIYIIFIFCELIPIFQNKKIKVGLVYSTIMLSAFIFQIMQVLGEKIPSPSHGIKNLFEFITK